MKLKVFAVQRATVGTDVALLLLRLVMGLAFVLHGWGKIRGASGWTALSWMPAEAPFHIPVFFQGLAALAEFGGGLALVAGLLTRLGALGITITMTVAVYCHAIVFGDPFVTSKIGSSYESALGYLMVALLYVMQGPGRFSLDLALFGTE